MSNEFYYDPRQSTVSVDINAFIGKTYNILLLAIAGMLGAGLVDCQGWAREPEALAGGCQPTAALEAGEDGVDVGHREPAIERASPRAVTGAGRAAPTRSARPGLGFAAASAGSACQSGAATVSHVLEGMGLTPSEASDWIRDIGGRAKVELSGGITLERVATLSALGVDVISVGALTHSAPSCDLGLDWS